MDVLMRDVQDATAAVRCSGLCDDTGSSSRMLVSSAMEAGFTTDCALTATRARVLVHVCAAARAHCIVPQIVLQCGVINAEKLINTHGWRTSGSRLDVHVDTGVHQEPLYLRDGLRVAGELASAVRYAVTVDALCAVHASVDGDPDTWAGQPCLSVLQESGAVCITGESSVVCSWGWMRRLHAVRGRRRTIQVAARCS